MEIPHQREVMVQEGEGFSRTAPFSHANTLISKILNELS